MNRQLAIYLGLSLVAAGCKREARAFHVDPPAATAIRSARLSELQPGQQQTNAPVKNDYEDNAAALSEGKQLFSFYNCSGCHANGGGGMGPPLMDDKWIYGSNPENVAATIVEGRPNGMPSFGGKIPEYQVWKLAAYVRSLGGLTSKIPAPGRNDDMKGKPPENSLKSQQPKNGGTVPPQ